MMPRRMFTPMMPIGTAEPSGASEGSRDKAAGRLRHLREAILHRWFVATLVCLLSVAVLMLVWIGHRAFGGWQRSAALLAERRAQEKAMLLSVALDRDMKAVQASVLVRFGGRRLAFKDPYELFDLVESAFSQFPYLDSIFVWRDETNTERGRLYVFNRVDRPPRWAAGLQLESPFPIALLRDPPALVSMVSAIRSDELGEQFLFDSFSEAGRQYQMAASLFYGSAPGRSVVGAVGFLADMTWVRQFYFGELMRQVQSVIGENGVRFSILDEGRVTVATSGAASGPGASFERTFPLAFLDRSLLAVQSKLATTPVWTIRVESSLNVEDGMQSWVALWWMMAIAGVASVVGVLIVAQSIQAQADLATMKSDFVATVTHDLKTPLALIKVVGETLGLGRYTSDDRVDEYGRLLRREAMRLSLRIDNLLAYARATDSREALRLDTVDLLDVIHESLQRAEPRLVDFEVDVNLSDAPTVAGDQEALLHVFDNLLDNAIKYSADVRYIGITATASGSVAIVEISDRGIGIAQSDLDHVFEKFFRGRNGRSGSGLGLAIAQKVVRAHRGTIEIESEEGGGTMVRVSLPLGCRA